MVVQIEIYLDAILAVPILPNDSANINVWPAVVWCNESEWSIRVYVNTRNSYPRITANIRETRIRPMWIMVLFHSRSIDVESLSEYKRSIAIVDASATQVSVSNSSRSVRRRTRILETIPLPFNCDERRR
jgi:hypothetical protein